MLQALILSASVASFGTQNDAIQCDFPGSGGAEKSISVVLAPAPSLKDQPGLYRVRMDLDGQMSLRASASPITSTEERDVLVRGITGQKNMYSVGLRDDGAAALNIQLGVGGEEAPETSTRVGHCNGVEDHLERWLPS